jgi:chaperonin cofactor prefoldin
VAIVELTFRRLLNQVTAKLQLVEREKRRNELTLNELTQIPPDTKTYRAVGKMFLLSPSKDLTSELQTSITAFDTEMTTLVVNRNVVIQLTNLESAKVFVQPKYFASIFTQGVD